MSNFGDRMVVVYEGNGVGADSEVAAEVVRVLVLESASQGKAGRFRVTAVTIARRSVAIRLECCGDDEAREAKLVFGAVVRAALLGKRFPKP